MTDTVQGDTHPSPGPSRIGKAALVGGAPEPRGEVATGWWRLAVIAAAVVALGVLAGRGWLLIVTAIFVMIFLHELGHYATAKWTGMKVTEFFIGIGPKLWSFRRGETEYGVKAIPLVAYVRIIGMNNLDETPPEDEPRTYRQQTFPRRLLVISAGSLMHFAQAFVLFLVAFSIVGVPGNTDLAQRFGGPAPDPEAWIVRNVEPDTAAERAGIEAGDRILSIAGTTIDDFTEIGPAIEDRIGQSVPVVVLRAGEQETLSARIGSRELEDGTRSGFLGVGLGYPELPDVTTGPADGVVEAGRETGTWIWETVRNLGTFFTGGLGDFADRVVDGSQGEDGPVVGSGRTGEPAPPAEDDSRVVSIVGVGQIGSGLAEDGMAEFLLFVAIVNISIGVLNMFPLLPLDGGHAAVAIYERVRSTRGRRHMADVSRLLPLTYAVVLFLGLIMMSSLYLDIVDPVGVG